MPELVSVIATGLRPHATEEYESGALENAKLDTIIVSPELRATGEILRSILRASIQDHSSQEITRALGKRAVDVTVQVSELVEARSEAPDWPRCIVSLAEVLHDVRLFIETETQRTTFYRAFLGMKIFRQYIALEQRLTTVLRDAGNYDNKLKATDSTSVANSMSPAFESFASCMSSNRLQTINCGEMFSNAHDLIITGGSYYNGPTFIQQTLNNDSCQIIAGLVPGMRVVNFDSDDLSLQEETHRTLGYRIHSAHEAGKARIVKVYDHGPQARERAQKVARFNQKIMHPAFLRMIAVSAVSAEVPFLVFNGGFEGSLEASLAKALQKDTRKSVILGLQTIVGLSSGLNYLKDMEYPFVSSALEHFHLFLSVDGDVVISFDPDTIIQNDTNDEDDREQELSSVTAVQPLIIFHGLCRQTFDRACQTHYAGRQINRSYINNVEDAEDFVDGEAYSEELPLEPATKYIQDVSSRKALRSPTGSVAVKGQRRELVWKAEGKLDFALEDVYREHKAFLDNLPDTSEHILSRRRGRYPARTAHRCTGYNRAEITLTPSIARSAIITHSTPYPHEICPVCHQVVKDEKPTTRVQTEDHLREISGIREPVPLDLNGLPDIPFGGRYPKNSTMIKLAIWGSTEQKLTAARILETIYYRYPALRHQENERWERSIRHNLSSKAMFVRVSRPSDHPGKGSYWTLDITRGEGHKRNIKDRNRARGGRSEEDDSDESNTSSETEPSFRHRQAPYGSPSYYY